MGRGSGRRRLPAAGATRSVDPLRYHERAMTLVRQALNIDDEVLLEAAIASPPARFVMVREEAQRPFALVFYPTLEAALADLTDWYRLPDTRAALLADLGTSAQAQPTELEPMMRVEIAGDAGAAAPAYRQWWEKNARLLELLPEVARTIDWRTPIWSIGHERFVFILDDPADPLRAQAIPSDRTDGRVAQTLATRAHERRVLGAYDLDGPSARRLPLRFSASLTHDGRLVAGPERIE